MVRCAWSWTCSRVLNVYAYNQNLAVKAILKSNDSPKQRLSRRQRANFLTFISILPLLILRLISHYLCHGLGIARSSVSQSSAAGGGKFSSRSQYGSQTDIKSSSRLAPLRQGTQEFLAIEYFYIQSQSPSRCRGTFPSWLRCISVISTDTDVKAYTMGIYLPSQSTTWSVGEEAWTSHPENRIVRVHDDDFPTACLSNPASMCQKMPPRFTTVCELTICPNPLT